MVGVLDPVMNRTVLCLIPKVDAPTRMSQFRPIALCTVVYKVITKAIVNCLKAFMPDIIGPTQSSFVPG